MDQSELTTTNGGMKHPLARITAIVFGLLWIVAGIAGMIPALFSGFLFDAPGSTSNPATIVLAISMLTFPFNAIGCGADAIVATVRRRSGAIVIRSLLVPLINIACGGAALAWIEMFQGGYLNG